MAWRLYWGLPAAKSLSSQLSTPLWTQSSVKPVCQILKGTKEWALVTLDGYAHHQRWTLSFACILNCWHRSWQEQFLLAQNLSCRGLWNSPFSGIRVSIDVRYLYIWVSCIYMLKRSGSPVIWGAPSVSSSSCVLGCWGSDPVPDVFGPQEASSQAWA